MPNTELPVSRAPHSEALLTLQISKRAGWVGLLGLAILCALIVVDIRGRDGRQSPPAQKMVDERPPATVPMPDGNRDIARRPLGELKGATTAQLQPPGNRAADEPEGGVSTVGRQSTESEQQAVLAPTILARVGFAAVRTTEEGIFNGAGATFPDSIYSKWFSEYHKLHPEIQFKYQAIGSGGGIRRMLDGTIDFGASDVPMSDDQLSQASIRILHVPTVLGAVVPIYNVPGAGELRFTPEVLAGIFLGKIVSWNDVAIARANPAVILPNQPIIVIHRSDGNTSNFVFTDYLSKVSGEWQSFVGKGTSVKWPIGFGGKNNEGVAGMVRQMEGAIGYVDLLYAEQSHIPFGSVRNLAGRFVRANLDNVTEAAASVREMPTDFRVSITNAPGSGAYPIASYTWFLVPQEFADRARGKELAAFLTWMINDGQPMTKELGYAPLPRSVAARIGQTVAQIPSR